MTIILKKVQVSRKSQRQLRGSWKITPSVSTRNVDGSTYKSPITRFEDRLLSLGYKLSKLCTWIMNSNNEKIGFTFFHEFALNLGNFLVYLDVDQIDDLLLTDLLLGRSMEITSGNYWMFQLSCNSNLELSKIKADNKKDVHEYITSSRVTTVSPELANLIADEVVELFGLDKGELIHNWMEHGIVLCKS